MDRPIVTVFGSALAAPGEAAYQAAYDLGRAVAAAGWTLCNGGYGGTMEAAARGAVEAGGHTIGVTCPALAGRGGANPYIRQELPAADLLTRLRTLVQLGRAFVALPGGTGTLLELALVWELRSKRLLPHPAPLILLGDHWRGLVALVRRAQPDAPGLPVAPDAAAAIALIREAWGAPSA